MLSEIMNIKLHRPSPLNPQEAIQQHMYYILEQQCLSTKRKSDLKIIKERFHINEFRNKTNRLELIIDNKFVSAAWFERDKLIIESVYELDGSGFILKN